MTFNFKKISLWVGIVVVAVLLVVILLWMFNGGPAAPTGAIRSFFGQAVQTVLPISDPEPTDGDTPLDAEGEGNTSDTPPNIFLIADGPIVAATFIEESNPTTTSARYITGEDGHVLDLQLDVRGAIPHVVSQTTIPGVQRAVFTNQGNGALLQYLQGTTIKTVYLGFQTSAASSTTSTQTPPQVLIQFLPDNIEGLSVAPDGTRVIYLTRAPVGPDRPNGGLDGYLAQSNGTQAKKLFSLPLSEVALSWTAPGALLAYSKASPGVPGIVFSVDIKTGAVSPLLYGSGITAIASPAFAHMLYQINDGSAVQTYINTIKTGSLTVAAGTASRILPEQCVAKSGKQLAASSELYCAVPLYALSGNSLDAWHKGTENIPNELVMLDLANNNAKTLGIPGSAQGGESSNIVGLSLSPRGLYASFINKNNGKLYGIRLTP